MPKAFSFLDFREETPIANISTPEIPSPPPSPPPAFSFSIKEEGAEEDFEVERAAEEQPWELLKPALRQLLIDVNRFIRKHLHLPSPSASMFIGRPKPLAINRAAPAPAGNQTTGTAKENPCA